MPEALKASVLRRLRRMDRVGRGVILRASVIGQRFDLRAILAISTFYESQVRAALAHACRLQLVESANGTRFGFRHALTRDVVYAELQAERIRPLHRRLARFLESMHESGESVLEELAHHAWAGADERRALHYNELAGDRAFAVHARCEARAFYARARGSTEIDSLDYVRLTQKLRGVDLDG